MLVFFTFKSKCDIVLKSYLVSELKDKMSKLLDSLYFVPFENYRQDKAGFPTRYVRRIPDRVDLIEFQWERNGISAFIINFEINFGVFDEATWLKTLSERAPGMWFGAVNGRVSSRTFLMERWFHVGYLPRLIAPRLAAEVEVRNALERVREIDRYATTGKSSNYLRSSYDGSRLPDRPEMRDGLRDWPSER